MVLFLEWSYFWSGLNAGVHSVFIYLGMVPAVRIVLHECTQSPIPWVTQPYPFLCISRSPRTRPRCVRTSTTAPAVASICLPPSSSSTLTPVPSASVADVAARTTMHAPARTMLTTASCWKTYAAQSRAITMSQRLPSLCRWENTLSDVGYLWLVSGFSQLLRWGEWHMPYMK